jgi:hypothetical protein
MIQGFIFLGIVTLVDQSVVDAELLSAGLGVQFGGDDKAIRHLSVGVPVTARKAGYFC